MSHSFNKYIVIIVAFALCQMPASFGFDIFDPFGSKARAREKQAIMQHRDSCLACTKILLLITEGKRLEARTHQFYFAERDIVLDAGEGICRIGEAEVLIARTAAAHPGVIELKKMASEVKQQLEVTRRAYAAAIP